MRNKLVRNKKGYSTGFTWIFGLVTLFGIGILYITFNQVFVGELVPTVKALNNASDIPDATKLEVNAGIDQYMLFFQALPYVLFFIVVAYMIIAAIRKEGEERYL